MPSATVNVLFGNTKPDRPCKLCGNMRNRFGTLIDCNGHSWLICMVCIDNLWAGNAAVIVDSEIEERAKLLVQEKLFGLADD